LTNVGVTPVIAASSGWTMVTISQSSAIRSGLGKSAHPGFRSRVEIANEWMVLGRSTVALGCFSTFLASSAVAARVKVNSRIFGVDSRFSNSDTRDTTVALLPVPGPASTRPDRSGGWLRISCCSGVGSNSATGATLNNRAAVNQ
jgi:hypothetical protein